MPLHVTIELNQEILAQVIAELELKNAPTFTLNHSGQYAEHKGKKVRGMYHESNNHVDITSQHDSSEREGLYVLTKHIRFTVLHELRHAWQREHWTLAQKIAAGEGEYRDRAEEKDANSWADYASPKYRELVQIKRQKVGNRGFSQLGTGTS